MYKFKILRELKYIQESKYKQNQDRRFILSYHVNDDKISIYEPMQR